MKCRDCRYWSSKLGKSENCGPVQAYCLSRVSPKKQGYTYGHDGCVHFVAGTPVDDMEGQYEEYRRSE